ncbi:MAG: hypothetical protein JSW50_00975, partial [Candidatus Latescibacterota bacterium]
MSNARGSDSQHDRRRRGKLILADGTRYEGYVIGGGRLPVWGEVVFNTSMTGYQEIIT